MNTTNGYFVAASIIALLVGLVHSVLGEKLIFRRLRHDHRLVPTNGVNLLAEGHIRILWASWHLVTIFGWGMGAVLLRLAWAAPAQTLIDVIAQSVAIAAFAGAVCVFVGTRARHPGWVGLLAIAACAWLGSS